MVLSVLGGYDQCFVLSVVLGCYCDERCFLVLVVVMCGVLCFVLCWRWWLCLGLCVECCVGVSP